MTDRFVVPEPSPVAQCQAAIVRREDSPIDRAKTLRAAYAIDVLAIAQAEVEAFRNYLLSFTDSQAEFLYRRMDGYLAQRFGKRPPSTAQGERCRLCGKWFVPNPARANLSCLVLHPPGSCCHHGQTEVPGPEKSVTPPGTPCGVFEPFLNSSARCCHFVAGHTSNHSWAPGIPEVEALHRITAPRCTCTTASDVVGSIHCEGCAHVTQSVIEQEAYFSPAMRDFLLALARYYANQWIPGLTAPARALLKEGE